MDKKQLLIKIIEKLQWSRDLADDILVILETVEVDDQLIDRLIQAITQGIKTVQGEKEKSALEKSLQQIQNIQKMEAKDKESDEEIEHILDDIQ